jgi:hypothetical protein
MMVVLSKLIKPLADFEFGLRIKTHSPIRTPNEVLYDVLLTLEGKKRQPKVHLEQYRVEFPIKTSGD